MDEALWGEDEASLVKNLKSICIVKLSFKNGIVSQVEANFSTVVGNNKKCVGLYSLHWFWTDLRLHRFYHSKEDG